MKSSHNGPPQIGYHRVQAMAHAPKKGEWQKHQKRRLTEQRRQPQLHVAQHYLAQNSPAERSADQYQRTNSAPIITSQPQHHQHFAQDGNNIIYQRE